jgi:hypothetical protein
MDLNGRGPNFGYKMSVTLTVFFRSTTTPFDATARRWVSLSIAYIHNKLTQSSARDFGDVSFGFNFAGTPASARRSVSLPKRTPATGSKQASAKSTIRKATNSITLASSSRSAAKSETRNTSKKRKFSSKSVVGEQINEDELAGSHDHSLSSSKSKRVSLDSRVLNPDKEHVMLNEWDADENLFTNVGDFGPQKPSPQLLRSNPRTPLVSIQDHPSLNQRLAQPGEQQTGKKGTKSPMTTIPEHNLAEQDELSYETIDAEANDDSLNQLDDEPAVLRRSETTFAPELEGTRDELTGQIRRSSKARSSVNNRRRTTKSRAGLSTRNRQSRQSDPADENPAPKKRRKMRSAGEEPMDSAQTVAVTVYRRSKKPSVDTDPLGAMSIPIVNAADVLAQILNEMGNKYISKVAEKTSKKQFESLLRYPLVSFMSNVQDLLFDVSTAQNSVYAMIGRLRSLKREQAELRAELMRSRRQREDIKLEIDQVRLHHASQVRQQEEENALHSMLYDLNMAIQRGRDRTGDMAEEEVEIDDDELLLHDVQQLLGNEGMIGSVRGWNSLLEMASVVLQKN